MNKKIALEVKLQELVNFCELIGSRKRNVRLVYSKEVSGLSKKCPDVLSYVARKTVSLGGKYPGEGSWHTLLKEEISKECFLVNKKVYDHTDKNGETVIGVDDGKRYIGVGRQTGFDCPTRVLKIMKNGVDCTPEEFLATYHANKIASAPVYNSIHEIPCMPEYTTYKVESIDSIKCGKNMKQF